MFPAHFKNPFVTHVRLYRTNEIFKNITLNDLVIVPFKRIGIRKPDPNDIGTKIDKSRILEADTRYPPIIYKSNLDPLNTNFSKEYCIFDGNHRVLKMISEGKTASIFFILTPKCFDGLECFDGLTPSRSTGCNACGE
jgi:hypothetical protein|tara:strand:+ start:784 stop:1197 length:414 start_codon:yes stop_codon:yes gene_type:complete